MPANLGSDGPLTVPSGRDPDRFIDMLDCSADMKAILKRSIATEPADRTPDVAAFCLALFGLPEVGKLLAAELCTIEDAHLLAPVLRLHERVVAPPPEVAATVALLRHHHAGRTAQAAGDHAEAERHYRQALEIRSDHLPTLTACARMLADAERWDDHVDLFVRMDDAASSASDKIAAPPASASAGQDSPVQPDGNERAEVSARYRLVAPRRWSAYIGPGILAASVAAMTAFLIARSTREAAPTTGSVHLDSVPPGADVRFDGTLLTDRTPLYLDGAPVGTRHMVRFELTGYEGVDEIIDIPKDGRHISVMKSLRRQPGKIMVDSTPEGAEIWIDGELQGHTPMTITNVEMSSAKVIELTLKDYQPYSTNLVWKDGRVDIDAVLQH